MYCFITHFERKKKRAGVANIQRERERERKRKREGEGEGEKEKDQNDNTRRNKYWKEGAKQPNS
jgi:hypothetical protein